MEELKSNQIDIENIKIPYVLKDKLLMAPGIWNDTNYDSESIINGFNNTEWNKEVKSIFLNHSDDQVEKFAGYVENQRLVGDKVFGDLHLYDKDTIIKVGLAGMKCGISPKLDGDEDEITKRMGNFKFLNFSIVTNPACKKAYINLSDDLAQITGMETERKRLGMSVSEFYAVPRDPPSESALPIFDATHVRNALARFNQTQFRSEEEKSHARNAIKRAAEKFKIEANLSEIKEGQENHINLNQKEVKQMVNEEIKMEVQSVPEMKNEVVTQVAKELTPEAAFMGTISSMSVNELSDWSNFVGKMKSKSPEMPFDKIHKCFEKKKQMKKELSSLSQEDLMERLEHIHSVMKEKQISNPFEEKTIAMSQEIQTLNSKVKELEAKLNEPAKKTVKQLSSNITKEFKSSDTCEAPKNATANMMEWMKTNI